ncbi:MAG: ATP-binding cassette domain-containing protein [Candidatus Marinimicrobia bacterium]|nr:ATP-binding cassette domain-containing protein [Candidatus Neomarinimicrobiota bacterium]
MIELLNISKEYNSVQAVDKLHIKIQPGRICGFLGPNGAGKTTSIRMLMNIIQPDEGEILFNGKQDRPNAVEIGYLPEERGLYQKISVSETLHYFAHLRNVKQAHEKIISILDRFELQDRLHSKVNELSKGNQQKLQFINTILHDPEYVILDEPLSGLDPVNQLLLKEILEDMKKAGKTIIFSSHQMEQVEKICDDVALINKGKLILSGSLTQILREYGKTHLQVTPENESDLAHPVLTEADAAIRNGSAYILLSGRNKSDLIARINKAMDIRTIKVAEPGLEDIFIQLVKGDHK